MNPNAFICDELKETSPFSLLCLKVVCVDKYHIIILVNKSIVKDIRNVIPQPPSPQPPRCRCNFVCVCVCDNEIKLNVFQSVLKSFKIRLPHQK